MEDRFCMVTTVTGKNQITLPAEVARKLGIHRGSRVDWTVSADGKGGRFRVLPSRGELARSVCGIGRKYGDLGEDWVKDLIAERVRDDAECNHSPGGKP
jgi:AbrB family looped-hinge helix DNA binding protein